MKPQVLINPKSIPVNDRAFNYGDGVFETILVRDGNPLFIDQHIKRFHRGCDVLKIIKPTKKIIRDSIEKSIGKTKNCIVKILYSRGLSDHGYGYDGHIQPRLYLIRKRNIQAKPRHFISLGFSEYKLRNNAHLAKIKHLNRLEQILGFNNIGRGNYDNYILLDERERIIECISSNIFFYKLKKDDYNFFSPELSYSGVDGIMRQSIIEYMKKKKFSITVKDIKKNQIVKFDGAFICNSVSGIQFIKNIQKHKYQHSKILESTFLKFIYG